MPRACNGESRGAATARALSMCHASSSSVRLFVCFFFFARPAFYLFPRPAYNASCHCNGCTVCLVSQPNARRYRNTLAWRRANDVDHTLQRAHPNFAVIKECYPHFFHGTDKVWGGRACVRVCVGLRPLLPRARVRGRGAAALLSPWLEEISSASLYLPRCLFFITSSPSFWV